LYSLLPEAEGVVFLETSDLCPDDDLFACSLLAGTCREEPVAGLVAVSLLCPAEDLVTSRVEVDEPLSAVVPEFSGRLLSVVLVLLSGFCLE